MAAVQQENLPSISITNFPQSDDSNGRLASPEAVLPKHTTDINNVKYKANEAAQLVAGQSKSVSTGTPVPGEIYHPSDSRRKRRKVSSEPEEKQLGGRTCSAHRSAVHEILLRPNNSSGVENPTTREAVKEILPADTASPKRKRGRPLKIQEFKGNIEDDARRRSLLETKTYNVKPPDFTRTKSVRLDSNGILVQSPDSALERTSHQVATSTGGKKHGNVGRLTLKNGKFTHSLTVRLRYPNDGPIGDKIDGILSGSISMPSTETLSAFSQSSHQASKRHTHPFFLTKASNALNTNATPTAEVEASVSNSREEMAQKPVAWKDLVFKSNKPTFSKIMTKPAWPPLAFQHVGRIDAPHDKTRLELPRMSEKKAKVTSERIGDKEDILHAFCHKLMHDKAPTPQCRTPRRLLCTHSDLLDRISSNKTSVDTHPAVIRAREHAATSLGPFDRGQAPGPLPWCQKYGPCTYPEVLQPDCEKLYHWLKSLAIHQVQQGVDKSGGKVPLKRRKKPKKREGELDDFIIYESDIDEGDKKIANAILIVGPSGCGKTASVYAVAKQLGVEVFEIHPGMRRSQKDIFEKVGDMAHNHLVQRGQTMSRDTSTLPEPEPEPEPDPSSSQDDSAQSLISTLFAGPAKASAPSVGTGAPQVAKEQKQSLILFEEVDHVFEDDRGFWTGVQSLIQNSKRPVILTCNSLHGVPVDELELCTILTYTPPPADIVGEYLSCIAASEGHIVYSAAIQKLYETKQKDLRATMMELDLWCQMTVGSNKGGLDWYAPRFTSRDQKQDEVLRIISEETFIDGLDLLPVVHPTLEQTLSFMCQDSDDPLYDWLDFMNGAHAQSDLTSLAQVVDAAENCSDAELLSKPAKVMLVTGIWPEGTDMESTRSFAISCATKRTVEHTIHSSVLFKSLNSLTVERPIFPPSQGRLAPSLDGPQSDIATDIAPFVRSIAHYDFALETQREELFSSQGKVPRTTRAARAAAEGCDKGSTRPERWFHTSMNLKTLLETGGNWPQWPRISLNMRTVDSTPVNSAAGETLKLGD